MTDTPVLNQYAPGGPIKQMLDFAASAPKNAVTEKNSIAFVGDSITVATIASNDSTDTYNCNRGQSFWLPFLSGQRIITTQALNFGVSGDTTTKILARMTPIVGCGAGYFHVMAGTNDVAVNLSQTKTNLVSIWTQLLATGAIVIASTLLPRTLSTQSSRDFLLALNDWIRRQQAAYDNFFVVDPAVNYGIPTDTSMTPQSGYSYDGLHPKAQGAYPISTPLVDLLNTLVPPIAVPCWTVTDVYSSNNPQGNILTNGILDGTAGTTTANGSTMSGAVADDWGLTMASNGGTISGLTITASKVTKADGRPGQRIQVSGTYSGAGSGIANGTVLGLTNIVSSPTSIVSAGDQLEAYADLSVAANSANISGYELAIFATVDGVTYSSRDGTPNTGDLLTADAHDGVFRTPPLTLPAGTLSLLKVSFRIYFRTAASQTAAFDATLAGVALRKVPTS